MTIDPTLIALAAERGIQVIENDRDVTFSKIARRWDGRKGAVSMTLERLGGRLWPERWENMLESVELAWEAEHGAPPHAAHA